MFLQLQNTSNCMNKIVFGLDAHGIEIYTTQGCLCSCVGPIIDVQMKLVGEHTFIFNHIKRPLFPAIYDAIVILRNKIHFRDGLALATSAPLAMYFLHLAFHDSYLFGCIHLIQAKYDLVLLSTEVQTDVILPFSSIFLFIKSYHNNTIAELSQLCYTNILRAIAFQTTDGLST